MQQGYVYWQQNQRLARQEQGQQAQAGDWQMDGEGVAQSPVQVVFDAAADRQGLHQGREAVFE